MADHRLLLYAIIVLHRQYCSRRLRRIYKGVRFLHGRGRYQKKRLEPDSVKDER